MINQKKEKKEKKLNENNKNSGITLISLVVTIIVLLILAGISISMLTGDKGILQKATDAKEKTEIASIKERAEIVKIGLQIDTFSRANSEKIKQNALVSAIHKEFSGSTYNKNKVTTSDKKYDIVVDDKLNISVLNHLDSSNDEILLDCEFYDYGHGEFLLRVIPLIQNENYEEWAQKELDKLSTDAIVRQQQLEDIFIEADKYYYIMYNNITDEELAEINEIKSFSDWMDFFWGESFTNINDFWEYYSENNDSVEDLLLAWEYVKPQEYREKCITDLTIKCGEEIKTINTFEELFADFWIENEGMYSITATTSIGYSGEKTVYIKLIESYVHLDLESTISLIENVDDDELIWEISDESIVTVSNGIVRGINTGTTNIELTNGDGTLFSNRCRVTVDSSRFNTDYGKVDIIWLSGTSNNYSETPNIPVTSLGTSRLIPVYWAANSGGEISSTISENTVEIKQGDSGYKENNWYNYIPQSGILDEKTSRWANAYNQDDGSYFVWIPRFAYRITYYSDENFTDVTGYYDGHGQWNASSGGLRSRLESGIETVEHNGVSYIVHPAFTDCGLDLGSWDEDVTGFWIAKYKMGKEEYNNSTWSNVNASSTTLGKVLTNNVTIRATSKPGAYIWRNIPLGYSYTNGINYNSQMKSHIIKNSEWGAVAYLTHSKFGRNTNEVYVNSNSNYITGEAGETINAEKSSSTYAYNLTKGMNASSTGNISGIYDLSCLSGEWVSAFNKTTSTAQYSAISGESNWTSQTTLTPSSSSTKYATQYFGTGNNTSSRYNMSIYSAGKTGDATKEVSKGGIYSAEDCSRNYDNWNMDYGSAMRSGICFFSSRWRI